MRLELTRSVIREWDLADCDALPKHADNPRIATNLRDAFPSPYRREHAERYIAMVNRQAPKTAFAVEVGGEAVGGIGLVIRDDVERISAELGYWLSEQHWGKGIMTEAVRAFTDWGFATFQLTRIFAVPFVTSVGSVRVLDKAGFVCEGRLRKSAIKRGHVIDQWMYATVR